MPLGFFVNRDKVLQGLPKDTSDIIFLGDSQIQGFEVNELFRSLKVKNRGIFYDGSRGVLYRVKDVAQGKPAKLFIEVGIYDLENEIPTDVISSNVLRAIILMQSQSPKTKIYIQSVLPTNLLYGEAQRSIKTKRTVLNKLYANIALKKNIVFIDLDSIFLDINGGLKKRFDVGDKIHLNSEGYMMWANILEPYLKM